MANEGTRERELHRYYQPWLETFHSHDPIPQRQRVRDDSHIPQSSTDKALMAFAQLGALRLGAKRGVVTLIDSKCQYVLAEATQSLSLMDDTIYHSGDELWLGNAMLPRGQGMSEFALRPTEYLAKGVDGSTYNTPAMVIPDIALDDRFKTKAFAGSGVSFYCGVPLVTKFGHHIGVYSVTDDVPRYGLDAEQLRFMVDMAAVVMQHLTMIKNARARARGERLIRGMSDFIQGQGDDNRDQATPETKKTSTHVTTVAQEQTKESLKRPQIARGNSSSGKFKGMTISNANIVGRTNYPGAEQQEGDSSTTAATAHPDHCWDKPDEEDPNIEKPDWASDQAFIATPSSQRRPKPYSHQERVFDRASKILRRSLGADGVVFIDASSANLSKGTQEPAAATSIRLSRTDSRIQPNLLASMGLDDQKNEDSGSSDEADSSSKSSSLKPPQVCEVIAACLANQSPQTSLGLSRQSLVKLLRRYPHGKCYHFDDRGRIIISDNSDESNLTMESTDPDSADGDFAPVESKAAATPKVSARRGMLKLLPGARTVVFLPLWDFARDRWNSAAFIWSSIPTKLMNISEEMPYLIAFGNSMMNELHRQNLLISDKAKATFLANISHELRSPLHGILGSIEFLHESPLDDFQSSMVLSVETCGKTLLDTVNHVLDFAKLNSLSKAGRQGITQATTSDNSLTSVFDLAMVVEEAVEAVYAGQVFRTANADALEGRGLPLSFTPKHSQKRQDTRSQIALGHAVLSSDVRLTVNIDDGPNWQVSSQPGAIRRILMNLLGNSLKYCDRGSIDVRLEPDRDRWQEGDPHVHACLTVTDTGQGMSEDFVRNHAFTAFTQENSLTSGTGLGLSIIRRIVDSLGGKIDMRSQKDVGTEVRIWLSLPSVEELPQEPNIAHQIKENTDGMMLCLVDPEVDQRIGTPTVPALRKMPDVYDSVRNLASQWFAMNVFTAPHMKNVKADLFIYAEPPSIELLLRFHGEGSDGAETPVIIICQNAFEANSLRSTGVHLLTNMGRIIEVLAQPVGPQKLARCLQRCLQRSRKLEKYAEGLSNDHSSRPVHDEEENNPPTPGERTLNPPDRPPAERRHTGVPQPTRPPLPHRRTGSPSSSSRKPLDNPSINSHPSRRISEQPVEQSPDNPRVLVVDDNHVNLQLLIAFVRKACLPYEAATNGRLALEAYQRACLSSSSPSSSLTQRFRYVIMDISMPIMDGMEATREIRRFEKQHAIEPPAEIIALTGMGEHSEVKERAVESGYDRFLTKPVRFRDLRALLD